MLATPISFHMRASFSFVPISTARPLERTLQPGKHSPARGEDTEGAGAMVFARASRRTSSLTVGEATARVRPLKAANEERQPEGGRPVSYSLTDQGTLAREDEAIINIVSVVPSLKGWRYRPMARSSRLATRATVTASRSRGIWADKAHRHPPPPFASVQRRSTTANARPRSSCGPLSSLGCSGGRSKTLGAALLPPPRCLRRREPMSPSRPLEEARAQAASPSGWSARRHCGQCSFAWRSWIATSDSG